MPNRATLFLTLAVLVSACLASGYDDYISEIEKRNQQLHSNYLSNLRSGEPNYFDLLDSHVSDLQSKHYVRDSANSDRFNADSYWNELLERTAAAASPDGVREARARGLADDPSDGLGESGTEGEADRMASALVGSSSQPNRREEEAFLNRIWGTQKVSGGAGKPGQVTGPGNKPQKGKVMTDSLPSYCDPPNPCPVGVDPKKLTSPCESGVQDTAEYNRNDALKKMATGQCPCDNEHMECPAGTVGVTSKKASHMGSHSNPYLRGNKRDKLDAKKSPMFTVSKRGAHANFESTVVMKKNPWLENAEPLNTVEKKAGQHLDFEEPLSE